MVVNSRLHTPQTSTCSLSVQPTRGHQFRSSFSSTFKPANLPTFKLPVPVPFLPNFPSCYPVCFHTNTNCPFCKPFVLTFIQIARGVGYPLQQKHSKKSHQQQKPEESMTIEERNGPPRMAIGIFRKRLGEAPRAAVLREFQGLGTKILCAALRTNCLTARGGNGSLAEKIGANSPLPVRAPSPKYEGGLWFLSPLFGSRSCCRL
jgi:hypothetical protein